MPPLPLERGDRILIKKISLKTPRNFKNPGRFDYAGYLKAEGIYALAGVNRNRKIKLLEKNNSFNIFNSISRLKKKWVNFIKNKLSDPQAAVVKAMVLGERGSLSRTTRELFNASGLAHLLAVSGLNVGFIATITFFCLTHTLPYLFYLLFPQSFLRGYQSKIILLLTLIPVLTYSLIVGEMISAIRASIMLTLFFLAKILEREINPYYLLSLAAFLILLIFPQALFRAGFQLSFIAVLAIIYANQEVKKISGAEKDNLLLHPDHKPAPLNLSAWVHTQAARATALLFPKLKFLFITTLSAGLGTLPLVVYYFNRLSPYSICLNLLAVPLAAAIVPLGLAGATLSLLFPSLSATLLQICGFFTSLLLKIAAFSLRLPGASLRLATPSLPLLGLDYCFILSLFKFSLNLWAGRKKKEEKDNLIILKERTKAGLISLVSGTILFISLFFPGIFSPSEGFLKITLLDVGQGSSTFIKFPNQKTMLIDGGGLPGEFDVGEAVLGPYLFKQGITRLDQVILTHPDNDHSEGIFFVLKNMKVKNYWYFPGIKDKRLKKLSFIARKRKIHLFKLKADTTIREGGVRIIFLHPGKKFIRESRRKRKKIKENNLCAVIKIIYGNFSLLLTSDLEKEGEQFLLKNNLISKSTLMLIPHHGSKTSSSKSFIKKVNPEVALVSAGYLNQFGHPKKEILKRYRQRGIKIYRTDLQGAIEIRSDGKNYSIKTHEDL